MVLVSTWREGIGIDIHLEGRADSSTHKLYLEDENAFGVSQHGYYHELRYGDYGETMHEGWQDIRVQV